MTKISNVIAYEIVNSPSLADYVIGTKTPNSNKPTKNFSMQGISNLVLGGLSPDLGGVIKITQLTPTTDLTSPAAVANLLSPSYTVGRYELLFLNLNGHQYLLKLPNITIGIDQEAITDADFIDFPVNQGPAGANGANGTNGTNGTNGLNANMTRTSTDEISIANTVSRTLTYASSSNLGWLVGTRLRFANSGTNYMEGAVTAVSSTSVTILVDNAVGTGTFTSWNIGIAGDSGIITTEQVQALFPARVTDSNVDETYTIKNSNFSYQIQLLKSPRTVIIVGGAVNLTGGTLPIGTKIFDIRTGTFRGTTSAFYGVNCSHQPHEIRTSVAVNSGATINFQIEYFAENI
jgi:hypothetical protein